MVDFTEICSESLPTLNPNSCFGTLCSSKFNGVVSSRKLDCNHSY